MLASDLLVQERTIPSWECDKKINVKNQGFYRRHGTVTTVHQN
jgi:hypothetical protein